MEMVVFDFDCTITGVHTCSGKVDNDLLRYIQHRTFRRLVLYLTDRGIEVAVASYGRKRVIDQVMKEIFRGYGNPFSDRNIITPSDVTPEWRECYNPPRGYAKHNMLAILSERYFIPRDSILLLDDSQQNVITARVYGFQALKTPTCQGFLLVAKSLIRKWFSDQLEGEVLIAELEEWAKLDGPRR